MANPNFYLGTTPIHNIGVFKSGDGPDTSDATATAEDIVSGETAYVNGEKITGTNPYEKTATDTEVTTQASKIAELNTILDDKAGGIKTCTITISLPLSSEGSPTFCYIINGESITEQLSNVSSLNLNKTFEADKDTLVFIYGLYLDSTYEYNIIGGTFIDNIAFSGNSIVFSLQSDTISIT